MTVHASKSNAQLALNLRNMASSEPRTHRADIMREAASRLDPTDESAGLRVARSVARYHIGDPEWADLIVNAYLNPEEADEVLKREMES